MQLQQGSKEEQYLNGRWAEQRGYYSKRSQRNKQWHQRLLFLNTIDAVIVPVLLNISQVPTLVPTILSVLVSAALALDSTYHFGDDWRIFRQVAEALKQERVYFENGLDPYDNPQTAFSLFVKECEEIMQVEGKSYFERHKPKEQSK